VCRHENISGIPVIAVLVAARKTSVG